MKLANKLKKIFVNTHKINIEPNNKYRAYAHKMNNLKPKFNFFIEKAKYSVFDNELNKVRICTSFSVSAKQSRTPYLYIVYIRENGY